MPIKATLEKVRAFHEVYVADPNVPRRSSVAVVLRFPGIKNDGAASAAEFISQLPDDAEAEILFIKRATSERDRWSSHIALPGGRREPGETDIGASVRETVEEVGIDLAKDGLYVGPLDQRPLKVSWGSRTIMVLCPYVFVLKNPDAKVVLQPTEIATAFWYSFESLLKPEFRAFEETDISSRLRLEDYKFIPKALYPLIHASVGPMLFDAIDLYPNHLLHISGDVAPPPYKLWGVTFGVLVDLFELHSRRSFASTVRLPTLKFWDMRFFIWLFSVKSILFKRRRIAMVAAAGYKPGTMSFVNELMEGYFVHVRRAILATFAFRTLAAILAIYRLARWLMHT